MAQGRTVAAAALSCMDGESQGCGVMWRDSASGLRFRLDVQLPDAAPILLWRLTIENTTPGEVTLDRIDMLSVGPARPDPRQPARGLWPRSRRRPIDPGGLRIAGAPGELRFYSHGWQSWSFTGSVGEKDRLPHSRLGPIVNPKHWNPGTPHPVAVGHAVSDMFGILADTTHRRGILAGSLSQLQAFTSLDARLDHLAPTLSLWQNLDGVLLDAGATFTTDWAALLFFGLDEAEPAAAYFKAAARESGARPRRDPPVGWCSWYQYFDRMNEGDLSRNVAWIEAHRETVRLPWILVDDGFEPVVGDWDLRKGGFPQDLRKVSDRIRASGSRPAVWLAPFVAHPRSRLAAVHPEWLLRTRPGWPVHVGFAWNTFAWALDASRPEVVEWTADVVRRACGEWGFEYLKLDFLYAGALSGQRFDRHVTRAQSLRRALVAMREAAGESSLLGCGCPIGSGIGIFESMRIGADVAPDWHPAYLGLSAPFRAEPEMPAVRTALRNAITRAPLHTDWWVNDPDCLLLRESKGGRAAASDCGAPSNLSQAEARTLASVVAMTGGSVMDSDDLPSLPADRLAWLQQILPPMPGSPRVPDLWDSTYPQLLLRSLHAALGAWWLLAVVNWKDEPADVALDLERWGIAVGSGLHCFDAWEHAYRRVRPGDPLRLQLPGHGTAVLALRPEAPGAAWLGDTFHLSQGLSVLEWSVHARRARARLALPHVAAGRVWLRLESAPEHAALDGVTVPWSQAGEAVWVFDLPQLRTGSFEVSW
jgi:alpha-galactosidase